MSLIGQKAPLYDNERGEYKNELRFRFRFNELLVLKWERLAGTGNTGMLDWLQHSGGGMVWMARTWYIGMLDRGGRIAIEAERQSFLSRERE